MNALNEMSDLDQFAQIINDIAHEPYRPETVPGGKLFVCGFLFNPESKVALIRKARPSWQAGKLNGIGGKVESGETPTAAMSREFSEETSMMIHDWRPFAVVAHDMNIIVMFTAFEPDVELSSPTDEPVGWYYAPSLPRDRIVPNLRWLIPMARSPHEEIAFVVDRTKILGG